MKSRTVFGTLAVGLFLAALTVIPAPAEATAAPSLRDLRGWLAAVEAIEKLGGRVEYDETKNPQA